MTEKRNTKKRVITYIAFCVIPFVALCVGIFLLFRGYIFNTAFAMAYVVLPLGSAGLFALIVFSKQVEGEKDFLAILALVFTVAFIAATVWIGRFESFHRYTGEDVDEEYSAAVCNFKIIPTLDEIGEPISTEYYDYSLYSLFDFTLETGVLICEYTEDEYFRQKVLKDEKYVFAKEPAEILGYACEPDAEIDGYVFRVVDANIKYGECDCLHHFPKSLVLIGTNDLTHEIVYMTYFNNDLDYIDSFSDHILNECGWKYMR